MVICGRKQETDRAGRQQRCFRDARPRRAAGLPRRAAEDLERLVDSATREFGKIDILVNNAGTNIAQGPAIEMDEHSSTRWWRSISRAHSA